MKLSKILTHTLQGTALGAFLIMSPTGAQASSHMDAPLITLDDAANTTDVYAFKTSREGTDYLVVALSVYPFETPGIGPNNFKFDDNVLYSIHIGTGSDVAAGNTTQRYDFRFTTAYKNQGTILQSFLGVINTVDDANQNLTQTYSVNRRIGQVGTVLGTGVVPPNNQGIATPLYNLGNNGEMPAKPGVAAAASLDPYTTQTIATLDGGYRAFAGQREDAFYADIQAIFDLLQLRSGGVPNSFDSQSGFNVHTIVLEIPVSQLGGAAQVVSVHATTSRSQVTVLSSNAPRMSPTMVQVGRQGNPLFCEALVAIQDKDRYNRTDPSTDASLFMNYALNPELGTLIDVIVFGDPAGPPDAGGIPDNRLTNRTDLVGLFIPDTIKVDLSTAPARLQGGSADDAGFSRLGIFGGDVLTSTVQPGFDLTDDSVNNPDGTIPGGWPNGRRFGDDVVDIAVFALVNDLRTSPPTIDITAADGIDNVSVNDSIYNKVFPYAGTPHNGRNYEANVNYVNPGLPNQP